MSNEVNAVSNKKARHDLKRVRQVRNGALRVGRSRTLECADMGVPYRRRKNLAAGEPALSNAY